MWFTISFQLFHDKIKCCTIQTVLYGWSVSATKQRVLETAAELFAERGYESVGINELIEKSGVAKATFYQHFRSKENLCAEWLRQEAVEADKASRELLSSSLTVPEKVGQRFDGLRHHLAASDFRGCPFSNTATVMIGDSEVRDLVSQYKAASRLFWQALALDIRPDPSAARWLGDALFLLFSGAATEAQNVKALWPVDSAKAAALELCH